MACWADATSLWHLTLLPPVTCLCRWSAASECQSRQAPPTLPSSQRQWWPTTSCTTITRWEKLYISTALIQSIQRQGNGTHILGPQRIHLTDFGDLLTFNLAPKFLLILAQTLVQTFMFPQVESPEKWHTGTLVDGHQLFHSSFTITGLFTSYSFGYQLTSNS